MAVKRLNPAISPCARCGVAADEQCVSLRTGRPIKYDHPGGRAVVLPVLTADQWAGDCTDLFKQLPGVAQFLSRGSTPYSRPVYGI